MWVGRFILISNKLQKLKGGGPRVVVSTAAFHARARGSVPGLGGLKETKNVSSPSTCESQYCGEPPWPRGSVLGLRPPGREFRIMCLEDSVISIISPSSGGSPGQVNPYVHKGGLKPDSSHFILFTKIKIIRIVVFVHQISAVKCPTVFYFRNSHVYLVGNISYAV